MSWPRALLYIRGWQRKMADAAIGDALGMGLTRDRSGHTQQLIEDLIQDA